MARLKFLESMFFISTYEFYFNANTKSVQTIKNNLKRGNTVKKAFKFYLFIMLFVIISSGFSLSYASENVYLIPCGQSIGVNLYTEGVIVTGTSEIISTGGFCTSPAEKAGIKKGDIITNIDGSKISSVYELKKALSEFNGKKINITVNRNNKVLTQELTPVKSAEEKDFVIGAWVKDATSGVGTLTYINPENNTFAALGHGICSAYNEEIIPSNEGEILSAEIISVVKGKKGIPGELKGTFSSDSKILGNVKNNTEHGLYGVIKSDLSRQHTPVLVGRREKIIKGKASIITTIENSIPKEYEIEILKISTSQENGNKDMIIKITDKELLEKTGGIVQGMSGSPIIQNGKLIGAVTHVFVNDPTKGYGIFIENMLSEAEKKK